MEIRSAQTHILDPIEQRNHFTGDSMLLDDNFILDITQELPIRKP